MSISSSIANDKLTELRNKKKLAIQALDFDAAEDYDRQIREQNESIIADRISKINTEILKDLQDHINKYDNIRNEISDFNIKQESQLNSMYQELLDKTQIQHEKELRNIDKSHGIALLREAEREVPDQIALLEQAKAEAVAGRYESARGLREKARMTGESELEERKTKIDNEFAQSRSMLAAKQQEAIQHITQKYDDEITNLNGEVQLRRLETEQRFDSGVQLIRQRAEIRCSALVADDEVKEDALFALNQRINEVLRDNQQKPPPAQIGSQPQKKQTSNPSQQMSPQQSNSNNNNFNSNNNQQKLSSRSNASTKSTSSSRSISSTSSSRTSSRNSPRVQKNQSPRLTNMSAAMTRKLAGSSASGSAHSSARTPKKTDITTPRKENDQIEPQKADLRQTDSQQTEIQQEEQQQTETQQAEIQQVEIQQVEIQQAEIQQVEIQQVEIQQVEIQQFEPQTQQIEPHLSSSSSTSSYSDAEQQQKAPPAE